MPPLRRARQGRDGWRGGTSVSTALLFLEGGLWLLALPLVLGCVYLLLLTLASLWPSAPPAPAGSRVRFLVRFGGVVPAHDEESGIARTVRNLLAMDWPKDAFRVLVVADNCHDQTAQRARDAGALVIERFDGDRRGKGYALE